MKKIAYVVTMLGGLESFVKREIELLAAGGVAIDIYTIRKRLLLGFDPPPSCKIRKFSLFFAIFGLAQFASISPIRFFRLLIEAIRFKGVSEFVIACDWRKDLLKSNAELIHASFGDRKFFVAYFLSKSTGIPLSTAIHAHEIYAQPNKALFVKAAHFSAGLVTISETNKKLLISQYGICANKIRVIPLSIDPDFWQPRQKTVVLTVARFTPRKGWQDLVSASKLLDDSFEFVAVGFGELEIVKMAEIEGVAHKFTVFSKLGPKEIRLIMQGADIFCLPSKNTKEEGSEGIPVALMEAMAMGLPVITTDDGSICELVNKEIVPQSAPEALASKLTEVASLLSSKEYSSDNRELVLRKHHPKNVQLLKDFLADCAI